MSNSLKEQLRKNIKNLRLHVSEEEQYHASLQVCKRITSLQHYKLAHKLGLYFSSHGEIDLNFLYQDAILQAKSCYFPSLNHDSSLNFLPCTPQTPLKKNRYNILEPDAVPEIALACSHMDILIIPLVAFDRHCTRIGMGAGYYDRSLEHNRPKLLLGAAYSFQYVDFIEAQPWDIPLDGVVTPATIYWKDQGMSAEQPR